MADNEEFDEAICRTASRLGDGTTNQIRRAAQEHFCAAQRASMDQVRRALSRLNKAGKVASVWEAGRWVHRPAAPANDPAV